MPGVRVTAVCDTADKSNAYVRQAHPEVALARSVADVFRQSDAVVIAAPSSLHARLASAALSAGLHVFVEKPLATTLREARAVAAVARKKKRVLQIGHLLLYHPAVRWLSESLAKNHLGRPLYLYSQRINLGVVRRDENVVSSLATHDISVCLHLLGEFPVKVSCAGQSYLQKKIEDVAFAVLFFKSGAVAHFHLSWLDPHKTRKITLVGSRKMAVFDDMATEEKLKIFDKGVEGFTVRAGRMEVPPGPAITVRYGDIHAPKLPTDEPLKIELSEFVRSCEANDPRGVLAGPANAIEVMAVMEALQKSLRGGGRPVAVGKKP